MQKKIQLTRILGLLAIRIVVSLAATFLWTQSPIVDHILSVFLKISDIAIILYLYYYLKKEKQLELPFWAVVLIVLVRVYFIVTGFFPIPTNPDTAVGDRILISMLPILVLYFAQVVLSLKMISNELEETTKPYVKRIGIAQLISIAGMLLFIELSAIQLPGIILIQEILLILPFAAMLHFYWVELKKMG